MTNIACVFLAQNKAFGSSGKFYLGNWGCGWGGGGGTKQFRYDVLDDRV